MEITSRDNRIIKEYRHLLSGAAYRRETGLFAIEGARLCEDAVRSRIAIEVALFSVRAREQYGEIVQTVERVAAQSFDIPDTLARQLGDTDSPQGIFCICRMPSLNGTLTPNGVYAALERIRDPGNLGTMIRSAEALGLDGILLSDGCCDPFSPKVLRSSMGGVFRLPLFAVGDLAASLPTLHTQGFRSFACVVDPSAAPVQDVSFGKGSICVIGNEGNGLTAETVSACTQRITIPMAGRAESLNASMAAGIIFWEMMRG